MNPSPSTSSSVSPSPRCRRPSTPQVVITETVERWKNRIVYRTPSGAKDEEQLLDFLNQHFLPFEPLNVAINLCEPGYRMAWFDNYCRKYISEGLSIMAVDTETQELVGLAITTVCKQSPEPSEGSDNEKSDCYEEEPRWAVMPVKFGKILDFLGHLSSSVDIFSRYNCDSYLELFILTTHSTKRYPGLGTELVGQTLDLARRKEFAVCAAAATSFYSQKIFARLGFEALKEIAFEEYKINGKVIFPKHGSHEVAKLVAKRL